MIEHVLKWHPRFAKHYFENGDVLCFSEDKHLLLSHESIADLLPFIEQQKQLHEYLLQSEDISEQTLRWIKVDQLQKDEILLENEISITFQLTDYSEQPTIIQRDNFRVYSLSTIKLSSQWLSELERYFESTNSISNLVIVDDYLDPRLEKLNQDFLASTQSWLMIKPTGPVPKIGPLFSSQNENAPCYQCLRHRLIQNNPVREWVHRIDKNENLPAIPVAIDLAIIEHFFQQDLPHYFNALLEDTIATNEIIVPNEQLNNDLVFEALDSDFQHSVKHYVTWRPQCHTCGSNQHINTNNDNLIILRDRSTSNDKDGGYRTFERISTLKQVAHLCSPISGLFTPPESIVSKQDTGIAIFRTAHFQNNYHQEVINPDIFVQLSLGKGFSDSQALCSALGEALERQAAQYQGEEKIVSGLPDELAHKAYLPQELSPFSEIQYLEFAATPSKSLAQTSITHPQWVKYYETDISLHWVPAWSLRDHMSVYLPAAFCLANTPYEDKCYSSYSHNGNAAGNNVEEAILQGLLELIERDAIAIWWYNQIPRPKIDLSIIPPNLLDKVTTTLSDEWDYWLLDLTNDIDVLTCAAVAQHKVSKHFALGFGSHPEVSVACSRAITELYQLICVKDKITGPFNFDTIPPHPFLFPKKGVTNAKSKINTKPQINLKTEIEMLVQKLSNKNLDVCVYNYSRPDIPLATLKVVVPGLCHMWPQLQNQRLYQVPVDLGWLSKSLDEQTINPMPLYL